MHRNPIKLGCHDKEGGRDSCVCPLFIEFWLLVKSIALYLTVITIKGMINKLQNLLMHCLDMTFFVLIKNIFV